MSSSDVVEQHGGAAIMTREDHPTGTDRLAEVAEKLPDYDVIINVQGDEPLIDPTLIDSLAAAFDDDPELQMATVKTEMTDEAEQQNPNNVKVVTDKNGYALYFSRSLMPYPRHHQLRALENGYRIKVIESKSTFVGVDTEEDLAKVNEIYKELLSKNAEAAK